MTKDEALKLAMEALEEYVNVVLSVNDPNEWTPKIADAGEPARKAIATIKEALAQPEQEQFALKHRIAELEGAVIGLQTQRTWVGLTLDERIELAQNVDWPVGAYCEYAEKIEAKLKEKNT